MKTFLKIASLASVVVVAYFADFSTQPASGIAGVQFGADAHAIYGVRRRSARRGAAVGYSAGAAAASSTAAANTTAQQTTTQPAEPAPAPAAAPPPVYGPLPDGTVITVLPAGCAPITVGGVQYQHCGENDFRAAFQGSNLVYVSATPE